MSRLLAAGLLAATCCWAQQIDLSSLDKLEAKAKSVNRVNLAGDQLKAAATMWPDNQKDERKSVVSSLQSVQVRNYEFNAEGQYKDSDVDPIRKQVAALPGCIKIVESKEDREHSEVYMCGGDKSQGMAIISTEPKEISVVIIRGPVSMGDLGRLGGLMGTPHIESNRHEDSQDKKDKSDK